jgi:hypothetical protein
MEINNSYDNQRSLSPRPSQKSNIGGNRGQKQYNYGGMNSPDSYNSNKKSKLPPGLRQSNSSVSNQDIMMAHNLDY